MQELTNEKDEILFFDAGSEQQVVESVADYLRKHFGDFGHQFGFLVKQTIDRRFFSEFFIPIAN